MRILIVEDERQTAENLKRQVLKLRPHYEVLTILSDVESSLEWLANNDNPDLIFLDIELGDGSSFELFDELDLHVPIVFTTAYNEYVFESFQVNNVDYLLKPVSKDALEKAITKFESLKASDQPRYNSSMMPWASDFVKKRFLVKFGGKMIVVNADDVDYFLKDELVFLITGNKRLVVNYTLEQLEAKLDNGTFFRINRQVIVNLKIIDSLEPFFGGRLIIQPKTPLNDELIVSQRKSPEFKLWLDGD